MTGRRVKWLPVILAIILLGTVAAGAQRGGGGQAKGGGPGGGGGQGRGNAGGANRDSRSGSPGDRDGSSGNHGRGSAPPGADGGRGGTPGGGRGDPMRSRGQGAQLGPVGRWWDDKGFARTLNLRPDQRQRMDAVFNANRAELVGRYQDLKSQESRLEETTRDARVNTGSVFTQIDRVAQAREALGAVNTRMTDALRKELDAAQIEKLQAMK